MSQALLLLLRRRRRRRRCHGFDDVGAGVPRPNLLLNNEGY